MIFSMCGAWLKILIVVTCLMLQWTLHLFNLIAVLEIQLLGEEFDV